MKRVILTLLMSVIMALMCAGSIGEPQSWQADSRIHKPVNDTPEMPDRKPKVWHIRPPEAETAELSADKSTVLSYISTDFSTEAVENAEPVSESSVSAKMYSGISEGDVIVGELTYYCLCLRCCHKTDGITASGYVIANGVQSYTASCNWLPFGAVIEADGTQYTIRDRGSSTFSSIGRADIFEPDGHEAALDNGRRKGVEIKIIHLP